MKSDRDLIKSGIMDEELDQSNKRSPFYGTYQKYKDDDELLNMAFELVSWSQQENSLTIGQFLGSRLIPKRSFHSYLKRSKELREAYEFTKEMLGTRRQLGCLKGELNGLMVWRTMALYDPDYKRLEEWRVKLKRSIEEGKAVPNIHIEMPNWYLDKPKVKKDKDE